MLTSTNKSIWSLSMSKFDKLFERLLISVSFRLASSDHSITSDDFRLHVINEVTVWLSLHPPVQEFAENLLNSGVHGAVMVLDPGFNTDTMATALGIPNSKHMVRRHLVEEMNTLIGSAR